MNQYVFLYRGAERPTAPQETQAIMQKWMNWMEELGRNGHLKDRGHPLETTAKLVTGKQKTVTDGPFAEAKDLVGGFSIVEAEDIAHAAELAKGCPIFERNGYVEVRPIMQM